MKIAKVTCWLLRIPFTFPLVKETQHALANFVEIETDDGLKGHALAAYPLKYGIKEFINREAAPAIVGLDALRPEEVRTRLFWATARKYFMGAWNCAASLIDIALWDIKGKALGQPIWKLLGGAHSRIPAYITFGLPRYSVDELIEVARMLIGQGQTRLKMVVAAGSHEFDEILGVPTDADILGDAQRVRALREAIGPKIELMMDANKGATYPQALNVPIVMGGNWPHINMHLQAATPNGGRVEYHWQGWKIVEALFDGAPPPVNGYTRLPEAPGLGFTPKPGLLDLTVEQVGRKASPRRREGRQGVKGKS